MADLQRMFGRMGVYGKASGRVARHEVGAALSVADLQVSERRSLREPIKSARP